MQRRLFTVALIATLAAGALATPAVAAPQPDKPTLLTSREGVSVSTVAPAAACPVPGQRVKQSFSPDVYVVGPGFELYRIPNPTVYFSLWDSWSGIIVYDALASCYPFYFELTSGHLAKDPVNPHVYIWDASYGCHRWIVNGTVFNKYAFSWGKIVTESSVFWCEPHWYE